MKNLKKMKNIITKIKGIFSSVIINGQDFSSNVAGGRITQMNICGKGNVQINGDIVGNFATSSVMVVVQLVGDAESIETISGDVDISGNVGKGVSSTSGDVTVLGSVGGDVETISGDVSAKSIAGRCSTVSGDIRK